MKRVTTEQFFDALYAAPGDIMPKIVNSTHPYISEWRDQRTGRLFGVSRGLGMGNQYFLADGEGERGVTVKKGDIVVFKPEWRDEGDEEIVFRALEDEDGGRVLVVAEIDLPIQPTHSVCTWMIAEVRPAKENAA